jgi:DNA mismatch repair ATPase MutS
MVILLKLVTRYGELKPSVLGYLLLMQVGAFMQVMDEDAQVLSQVTNLKLPIGGEVDTPVIIGGFPKSGI